MAMSAAELAVLQAGVLELLFERMDVYAVGSVSGAYDTRTTTAVACLLYKASEVRQQTRAEEIGTRDLLYDPAYMLDEHAQIEVAGVRWNVIAGSIGPKAVNAAGGGVLVNACLVERAGA